MKFLSLPVILFLSFAICSADVILDPETKPRRHETNNVLDTAQESDLETVSASQDDLSEQPFDYYSDEDFAVEDRQEN